MKTKDIVLEPAPGKCIWWCARGTYFNTGYGSTTHQCLRCARNYNKGSTIMDAYDNYDDRPPCADLDVFETLQRFMFSWENLNVWDGLYSDL